MGLRIFAAGSLRPAFDVLAGGGARPLYANARDLAGRIVAGEEADVFASASARHPAALHAAGLVERPRAFAGNRLVVAVPAVSAFSEVTVLAASGTRVVIEVEGIPLGDYTRDLLVRLDRLIGAGFADRVLANVVAEEQTVDAVAARLAAGEADAAVLYATDVAARPAELRAIEPPPAAAVATTCLASVVSATTRRGEAEAWVERLGAAEGLAVLRRAGFGPPPGA